MQNRKKRTDFQSVIWKDRAGSSPVHGTKCPVRIVASSSPSQGGEDGSKPSRGTIAKVYQWLDSYIANVKVRVRVPSFARKVDIGYAMEGPPREVYNTSQLEGVACSKAGDEHLQCS